MRRRIALPLVAAALGIAALIAWLGVGDRPEAAASNELGTVAPRTFTATVVAIGAVKPQIGAEVRAAQQAAAPVGGRLCDRIRALSRRG